MNGVINGEFDFVINITPDLYESLKNGEVQTVIQEMQTF